MSLLLRRNVYPNYSPFQIPLDPVLIGRHYAAITDLDSGAWIKLWKPRIETLQEKSGQVGKTLSSAILVEVIDSKEHSSYL